MDLSLLLAVERAAERELRGEKRAASTAAQHALALHRTPVAERIAGFIHAQQAGDRQ
jgi:hypothetical protein